MNSIQVVATVILLAAITSSRKIQTKNGFIEGTTEYLSSGKVVDAFLGIPFAAPPTGANRFLSPQPVVNWNGTLQTTELPPSCHQAASAEYRKTKWDYSESEESEDCLYLNVWKPTNAHKNPLPVMFWIHGGGYQAGSSNLALYNGSILSAEEKVIVVSTNYRLTMFAWLYLNSSSVMGNAGLQDQLQALQWVQDNIAAFGGDPSRVTIFGESVGGISVGFHLQNPNAYHLFRNGIAESGPSTLLGLSFEEDQALNASLTLAQNVNCPSSISDNREDVLSCLRGKTPDELLAKYRELPMYLHIKFLPIRNGIEVPLNPAISASQLPPELRKNCILGSIPNEFSYFLDRFIPGKDLTDSTTVSLSELRTYIDTVFQLQDEALQDEFISEFSKYATNNQTEYRVVADDIITDSAIICLSKTLASQFKASNNHVYYYFYTHRPSTGAKWPVPEWARAIHGDESPFVFGHPLNPEIGYTKREVHLSKTMMKYWASFARTGNPNHKGATVWPELKDKKKTTYLEFNTKLPPVEKKGLKEQECNFINVKYPKLLERQRDLNNAKKR